MATLTKAQHNQEQEEAANDQTPPGKGKPKTFNLLGWRHFGLFKPCFKFGSRRKNPAYEKGYN